VPLLEDEAAFLRSQVVVRGDIADGGLEGFVVRLHFVVLLKHLSMFESSVSFVCFLDCEESIGEEVSCEWGRFKLLLPALPPGLKGEK